MVEDITHSEAMKTIIVICKMTQFDPYVAMNIYKHSRGGARTRLNSVYKVIISAFACKNPEEYIGDIRDAMTYEPCKGYME